MRSLQKSKDALVDSKALGGRCVFASEVDVDCQAQASPGLLVNRKAGQWFEYAKYMQSKA
jgi:hypothetical protein